MEESQQGYLTADEVAVQLRATGQSVRQWSTGGGFRIGSERVKLASVAAGRRYLYLPADVAAFVAACTAARERVRSLTYAGDRPPVVKGDGGYAKAKALLDRGPPRPEGPGSVRRRGKR